MLRSTKETKRLLETMQRMRKVKSLREAYEETHGFSFKHYSQDEARELDKRSRELLIENERLREQLKAAQDTINQIPIAGQVWESKHVKNYHFNVSEVAVFGSDGSKASIASLNKDYKLG